MMLDLLEKEPRDKIREAILERAKLLTHTLPNDSVEAVIVIHEATARINWREQAGSWLAGGGVNNQGRVRSDNVAPLQEDGLLFRSPVEIRFYRALKTHGIAFAPLPVFIHGGQQYHRLEPDFLILKDGIAFQVEIDGDTVHRETPAQAQHRTDPMEFAGVKIRRIASSDIRDDDEAARRVNGILKWIDQEKKIRS